MKDITPLDLAYWAGVFDYRGRITMRLIHAVPCPYIVLKTKEPALLGNIVEVFGGKVRHSKSANVYEWDRTACSARETVAKLAPYMQQHKDITRAIIDWKPRRKRHTPVVFPPKVITVNGAAMSLSK